MAAIQQPTFTRYLLAKKSLDDRSLNRHVYGVLARKLAKTPAQQSVRLLELGAGCGTMVTRLIEWGLLRSARYTALDSRPGFVDSTCAYLAEWAEKWDYQFDCSHPYHVRLERGQNLIHLDLRQEALADYLQAAEQSLASTDVLIAHAFLDLVDLPTTLPALIESMQPGGYLYLTLNFDGQTIFEPAYEPALQKRILDSYHARMDERQVDSQPSGDSRTGRRLMSSLVEAGLPLLAAGSSDWVVYPGEQGYIEDEQVVLEHVLDTIAANVGPGPDLAAADLQRWLQNRRELVASGRLIFIAHQLDVLAQKPPVG